MLILAVDTSTKAGSIAVLSDGSLLGVRASCTTAPHVAGLFVDLQGLLEKLGTPITAFELFAVAAGPGSFTGLRIGLTAVKAWAEAFSRPVVAVSSLEAIAFQAQGFRDLQTGTLVAAVQDARRGQVFGRVYNYVGGPHTGDPHIDGPREPFEPRGEEVVLAAREFISLVADLAGARKPIFVSPAAVPIRDALVGSAFEGSRVEEVSAVLAPFIGEIGYARALRGEVVDALHLDANYVRRTDAEVKWEDRSPA